MTISKLILEGNLTEAKKAIFELINSMAEMALEEIKENISEKYGTFDNSGDSDINGELVAEARFKIVKARIRNGKIQRRKKISTVKGYTIRKGKLTRMLPKERRNRKIGQRRGKIKRKRTIRRALVKRKRSLRKRRGLGLR